MSRGVRVAGYVIGTVLVLVILLLGGLYGFSQPHFDRSYQIDPEPLAVEFSSTSEELIARGDHLIRTRGCMDCHAEDLGGAAMIEDPMVGTLWGSNLTAGAGGVAEQYEERDWVRAIRHGVDPEGKPLVFMPAHEFWVISDEDLGAMIAYIEQLPPVDRLTPPVKAGPIARGLFLAGKMPLIPAELVDHEAARPLTPPPGLTVEYGGYLASGCVGCHGPNMSGGRVPGTPPDFGTPANITPDPETGIGNWDLADFTRAMREGISRDGSELGPTMPIQYTKEFTDMELEAMWKYLRSLEPRPFGNR